MTEDNKPTYKQMFRSKSDRMLFGVCAGIAKYFEIDPVLVRVLFVISAFFGGFGVLVYIVLAIVMPEEGKEAPMNKEDFKKNAEEFGKEMKDSAEKFSQDWREHKHEHRYHSGGRFWVGALLLFFGVMFLLGSLGFVAFSIIGHLWPVILILVGISILLRD